MISVIMVDNRPNKKEKSFTREKSLLTDIFSFHAVAIIYALSSEKKILFAEKSNTSCLSCF